VRNPRRDKGNRETLAPCVGDLHQRNTLRRKRWIPQWTADSKSLPKLPLSTMSVCFGVGTTSQRAVISVLAHVRPNLRTVCRAIPIRTGPFVFTISLRDHAHSQSYKPSRYGSCHFRFDR